MVVVGFVWDSRNEGEGGAGDGVQLYVLIMHIPRGSTKNTMCLAKNYFRFSRSSKVNVRVNLFQKLFFLQNMGRTCCIQKLF